LFLSGVYSFTITAQMSEPAEADFCDPVLHITYWALAVFGDIIILLVCCKCCVWFTNGPIESAYANAQRQTPQQLQHQLLMGHGSRISNQFIRQQQQYQQQVMLNERRFT